MNNRVLSLYLILLGAPSTLCTCWEDLQRASDSVMDGISLTETMKAGDVLLHVTDGNDLQLQSQPSVSIFVVENGELKLSRDLNVDDPANKDFCREMIEQSPLQVTLGCPSMGSQYFMTADIFLYGSFNDNYPTHPVTGESVPIPERTSGQVVWDFSENPLATDQDCGSTFVHSISRNEDHFQIPIGNTQELVLIKQFDYEVLQSYDLNVTIFTYSHGQKQDEVNATLRINIQDEDDVYPIFDVNQFMLHVEEEKPVSQEWLKTVPALQARDGDVGLNSTINYSIIETIPNTAVFEINQTSGEIRVLNRLDRETNPSFKLQIKAVQSDYSVASATTTVSVVVDDVNDNRPHFLPDQVTQVSIPENAGDDSFVTSLVARDDDEGDNALFNFHIQADTTGAFGIKPVSGSSFLVVTDSSRLQGKTSSNITIMLLETEPAVGAEQCSAATNCIIDIHVDIRDVNDHSPVFDETSYSFNIYNDLSQSVADVHANDEDRGGNSVVTYSLQPVSSNAECQKLQVGVNTGQLTLLQPMLAGVTCSYIVMACDNPAEISEQRCASVPVSVYVLAGSRPGSNSPHHPMQYDVNVREDVPPGTIIIVLPGPNLRTDSTDFKINGTFLQTMTSLDRESQESYNVSVFLGDQDPEPYLIVRVMVDDVNDNAPVIEPFTYDLKITNDSKIGDVVAQIQASDSDSDVNSQLTYSLITGSDWFSINSSTGQITLTDIPTQLDIPWGAEFSVAVEDSGQPALESLAKIKVFISIHNESATLLLPVAAETLLQDKPGLERKLSALLVVTIHVNQISSLGPVAEMGSRLFISGQTENGQLMTPEQLNTLLEEHADDIHQAFASRERQSRDDDDDDFVVPFIIVSCVCGVLAIALIAAILYLYIARQRYSSQLAVFQRLSNQDTTIYDRAPILTRHLSNGSHPEALGNHAFMNASYVTAEGDDELRNSTSRPVSGSDTGNRLSNGSAGQNDHYSRIDEVRPVRRPQNENSYANGSVNSNTTTFRPIYPVLTSMSNSQGQGHSGNPSSPGSHKTTIDVTYKPPQQAPASGQGTSPSSPQPSQTLDPNWSMRRSPHIDLERYPSAASAVLTSRSGGADSETRNSSRVSPALHRRNSEADSGLPDRDKDDNDHEVSTFLSHDHAHDIYSEPQPRLPPTFASTSNVPSSSMHGDIMTPKSLTPGASESNRNLASSKNETEEPEPDYSKRVTFGEGNDDLDLAKQDNDIRKPNNLPDDGQETDTYDEYMVSPRTEIDHSEMEDFFLTETDMTAL